MAHKLDLKDKRLLYSLSLDARVKKIQLANFVGLSKNNIVYRIDRLKKEGVIKNFTCAIDLGILGYCTFGLLLKFNRDIYDDKEVIDFFKEHEFVDWVVVLSGQWDLFAEFVCKDLDHYRNTIAGINKHFNEILQSYQTFFSYETLRIQHLIKAVYNELSAKELPKKRRKLNKFDIDEIDRKILFVLTQDSSLHYLKLSKHLGLSLDVIRYRIKKLLEKEIIIGFFPEISLTQLGYTEYFYKIQLKNVSIKKIEQLKRYISNNEHITYAFVDVNTNAIIFICAFQDAKDIDHLTRLINKEYADIIQTQDYLLINNQLLFSLFPKGLLKID